MPNNNDVEKLLIYKKTENYNCVFLKSCQYPDDGSYDNKTLGLIWNAVVIQSLNFLS